MGVVVTTYNHAHFLDDALRSIAHQTVPPAHVVVVDDGSEDDPAAVVSRWPGVQLIRQDNQGLSSARNTGLRATPEPFVIFLDADDLLEPQAVEAGLRCAHENPDAAFVYGAHRRSGADGRPEGCPIYEPLGDDVVATFLRGNVVSMHAAVLYRTSILRETGGFDEGLTTCEDYDVYLRLAHSHRVASHSETVACYRWHGLNMSRDHLLMQRGALHVQQRYRPSCGDAAGRRRAFTQGRRIWRDYYAQAAVRDARADGRSLAGSIWVARRHHPSRAVVARWVARSVQLFFGSAVRRLRGARRR